MAGGGKEYTLTFLLKAAADSSYQAAFNKAKQELGQFQQQIQSNNTLLRDISAYERQEQAVRRAAENVEKKTAALEKARAAAEAAGNADEKLNAAQLKAEAAVKTATERLTQQEQKLRTQGDALRQAGVNTDNLSGEQARLAKETEALKQKQEDLADSQNKMIDSMAEMEAMAAEAYVAVQVVGKLAEEWEACVDAASGFQYAMSATEAVTQATAAEMEQLTAVAKETGATTIFTATEIASAMEYMGLAGWSAQEMIEGIPSVANLAAAAGEDLSRVCDIVTDAMMALGYGTEDTARFCDVLAQTARTANTNVDKMGDSLKYVSSTAGAMNYSIEDVATAMADLANSGIKGSMAGTALRNILASLADPSDEAAEALDTLGVKLSDTEGDLYSLNDVVTQLRDGFSGLNGEEKTQYASMIAGKRGMVGVLALVNTSQEAYDELAATINDCTGAAETMAGTRLDNFKGQAIILESAFDALKTSIGEAFLPALEEGAKQLTGITNAANQFVIKNQEVVIGASAAVAAFGAMAVGITGTATAMKLLQTVFAGSFLAHGVTWAAVGAVAALVGIGVAIASAKDNMVSATEAAEELQKRMDDLAQGEADIQTYYDLRDAMNDTDASAEELAATQSGLDATINALKESYPEWLGQLEAGTEAWDLQTEALRKYIEAEKQLELMEAMGNISELAGEVKDAKDAYDAAVVAQSEFLDGMREAPSLNFEQTLEEVQGLVESLQGDIFAGSIKVDYDEDSDFMGRLLEIQEIAQTISAEPLELGNMDDVLNMMYDLESQTSGAADVMSDFSDAYADASNTAAESSAKLETGAGLLRSLAEAGFTIAGALDEAGLTLSDIGLTSEEIGRQVATGMISAEEACTRYGITMNDVQHHVQVYSNAMSAAGEATDEAAETAKMSKVEFDRMARAMAGVSTETLTAEQASVIFGIELEALNEALEQQEIYEQNVADAVAAVDGGFLRAETAADRFGVSLEAMDAYRAQQELYSLQEMLEELEEAYDSAYDSALSSIQGQGSLLEGLSLDAERTKLTLTDALSNMQEIESYWANYSSNMEALQGYGLSTDFLTRYCDTSADGVANTQDLADRLGSLNEADRTQWVESLNTAFQSMADQEKTTADATADLETQYTTTAQAIETRISEMESSVTEDLSSMVSAMDQSGQAYTNGTATASAFVQAIRDQIDDAWEAASELAAAGTPGGGTASYTGGKAHGGFTNGPELAGEDPSYPVEAVISFNPKYREENIGYLRMSAEMLGVDMEEPQTEQRNDWSGYDYGGLTEYGEIMLGSYAVSERASEAPVYLGSGGGQTGQVSIAYSPTIQVSGDTTREELLRMLRQYDQQLVDKFMRFQADMERTHRRTSYG